MQSRSAKLFGIIEKEFMTSKLLIKTLIYLLAIASVILPPISSRAEKNVAGSRQRFYAINLLAGEKYALVIGISKYSDQLIPNLKYADNDAIKIGKILINNFGFSPDKVIPLINEVATRENILFNIDRLSQYADNDDIVFIYYSGHGTYGEDRDGDEQDGTDEYILPTDAKLMALDATSISDDILGYWVKRIKSKKLILVFDSCYSGGAAKNIKGINNSHVTVKTTSKNSIISDISRDNIVMFSASRPDQLAQEPTALKSGLFSHYLCKGLEGEADHDGDNLISFNELYAFVSNKVKSWTFSNKTLIQEPIYHNSISAQFSLAVTKLKNGKAKYISPGKTKKLVQEQKVIKIKTADGYYKSISTGRGHWVRVDRNTKVWEHGKSEKVWVPPQFKEQIIPAKYILINESGGKFVIE